MKKQMTGIGVLSLTILGVSMLAAPNYSQAFFGGGERGERFGQNQEQRGQGFRRVQRPNIERTVEKISNGIVMTMTSDDAEVVERMQNKEPRTPRNEDVQHVKENIENGIRVTVTSDDPDLVEKIQNRSERGHRGHRGNRGQRNHRQQGRGEHFGQNVERSVEKITNGVVMTITSDDEAIVEKLQNREPRHPRNEDVQHVKENIENGIRVTVTSDDPDLVEKIQNHSEKKGRGRGGRGHRGGGFGQR